MRNAAAIPAVALLAGFAAGLLAPDRPADSVLILILGVSCVAAVWAWRAGRPLTLAVAVGVAFFAGGARLARDAWERAWRPSLRVAFEELAREQRTNPSAPSRASPAGETVAATLTGVLTADGSPSDSGIVLNLRARELDSPTPRVVSGGVLLTVVGEMARARLSDWRAGRTVRAPVTLRRPARYLDLGVPDEERALARRGTTIVGSVKSGALVEMVAPGDP